MGPNGEFGIQRDTVFICLDTLSRLPHPWYKIMLIAETEEENILKLDFALTPPMHGQFLIPVPRAGMICVEGGVWSKNSNPLFF